MPCVVVLGPTRVRFALLPAHIQNDLCVVHQSLCEFCAHVDAWHKDATGKAIAATSFREDLGHAHFPPWGEPAFGLKWAQVRQLPRKQFAVLRERQGVLGFLEMSFVRFVYRSGHLVFNQRRRVPASHSSFGLWPVG